MSQHYSCPADASDPHRLPDIETFTGYIHTCEECGEDTPLFPDYYGRLYQTQEACAHCAAVGTLKCADTLHRWFYWFCLPGCLPDSDPSGPFETEAEALADAREGYEE